MNRGVMLDDSYGVDKDSFMCLIDENKECRQSEPSASPRRPAVILRRASVWLANGVRFGERISRSPEASL